MNAPGELPSQQQLLRLIAETRALLVRLGCTTAVLADANSTVAGFEQLREMLQRIEDRVIFERQAHTHSIAELQDSMAQTKRFAEVAARTHNVVIITDESGKIEWINGAFTEVTGYGLAEVRGKSPGSCLQGPDTDPATVAKIRDAIAARCGFKCDIVNYAKNGRKYWLSIDCQPVFDEAGAFVGFIAIEADVTDQKEAERELQAAKDAAESANRAKSMFLANMSHEIRTPMNGVMGMSELLLASVLTRTQRRYVVNIRNSSEALLKIINDILDLSKIEAGRLEIENTAFDLHAMLRDIRELHAPRAMQKGLNLSVWMHPDVPAGVVSDPVRLRQILLNLMGNALKFTSEGDVSIFIEIVNQAPSARLRFAVRDSGIGIPEEACARLFESFSQADASTTRRFGGTGLGLSISRRLVELMQGAIGVESEMGKGSTFWFEIPLVIANAPLGDGTNSTSQISSLGGNASQLQTTKGEKSNSDKIALNVLLVEDNEVNREIGCAMLDALGHRVSVAENGVRALKILAEHSFDVVLMDCQMPEMDGFTATKVLRDLEANGNLSRTPVIALTANALQGDRDRCLAAGMDDYLSKPFRQSELGAVLHRCLRRSRTSTPQSVGVVTSFSNSIVTAVLDADALSTLRSLDVDGSDVMLGRILRKFVDSGPSMLKDVVVAAQARDADALVRAAHAMKSPSANVGARMLAQIAQDVETHARAGNVDRALSSVSKLESAYRDTVVAVKELLKSLEV